MHRIGVMIVGCPTSESRKIDELQSKGIPPNIGMPQRLREKSSLFDSVVAG